MVIIGGGSISQKFNMSLEGAGEIKFSLRNKVVYSDTFRYNGESMEITASVRANKKQPNTAEFHVQVAIIGSSTLNDLLQETISDEGVKNVIRATWENYRLNGFS